MIQAKADTSEHSYILGKLDFIVKKIELVENIQDSKLWVVSPDHYSTQVLGYCELLLLRKTICISDEGTHTFQARASSIF